MRSCYNVGLPAYTIGTTKYSYLFFYKPKVTFLLPYFINIPLFLKVESQKGSSAPFTSLCLTINLEVL